MALVLKDRVRETTTTVGTGTYTLAGAVQGFQSFGVIGDGNTTYYSITDGTDWEVGIGTYTASGTTLSRDTILESSNSGSAVNWSAGTKDIFVTYPAERSVYLNGAGSAVDVLDIGTLGTSTANITTANITAGTVTTTPTSNTDLVNKLYVDNLVAAGIHFHTPVRVESPTALTVTYNNGSSGVGATLTNAGAQAALVIDGVTLSLNDRVLIYTQTDQTQNGIYYVSNVGSVSTNWVLTRATDADSYVIDSPNGLSEGSTVFVQEGTTGAGETYTCNTSGTITFGTTNITFVQISSAQIYSAGTGLTLTGTQFSLSDVGTAGTYGSASQVPVFMTNAQGQVTSVTNTSIAIAGSAITSGTVAVANGGTGQSTYTDGQLLIGNTSGNTLTKATLTAGTGITVTNGNGSITVAAVNNGTVTSVSGTGTVNGITLTGTVTSSGNLTLGGTLSGVDLSTQVTGTLPIANGGTGQTTAQAAMNTFAGAVTSGSYLRGNGSNVVMSTIQAGDVPTLNQNTTGSAATLTTARTIQTDLASTSSASFDGSANITPGVTGRLAFSNVTQGSALSVLGVTGNAIADVASIAASTDNQVLRRSGTALGFGAVNLASSDAVTGALTVTNGGTGGTTQSTARTGLGATTLGSNLFTITNPSAITFPRFNADNTVSALNDSDFRTAIGAGTGNGTVTSVGGTGTVNGITLTGTVTSSGSLTLGGTLSGVSLSTQVTGTLPVANGGTGLTSIAALSIPVANSANTYTTVTPSAGQSVRINASGTAWEAYTPSAGGSGTVTSIDVSGGTTGLTTSGGPITTSGTITLAGTLAIANGGTGQTTQQAALNALAGAVTSGSYLRGNGTNVVMSSIQAGDVPTLNQNTTGSAATLTTARTIQTNLASTLAASFNGSANITPGVTGTLPIANGGTGATNASTALSNLGGYPSSNPNGYTSNTGTVTNVSGTGTVNGITLSGSVSSSGSLSLSGGISGVSLTSAVTGTLPVGNGGTGLTTYAQGDIIYSSAANTLASLAKNTTATRYLANTGTNNNPAWAQVNLANGVTGTLPVGNGGTGAASWTANGIIYASGTTTLAQAANFIFDGSNLAIGQTTSTARLTSQTSSFGDTSVSSNCALYGKTFGGSSLSTRTIQVLHAFSSVNSASSNANIQLAFVQSNNNNTSAGSIVYTSNQGFSFRTDASGNGISADTLVGNERFFIGFNGAIHFPGLATTASAANAFLNSGSTPANQLLRSTSSIKYKTNVEPIEQQFADAVLKLQPVWYRSKAENDRKDWSWYGLVAEDVAQVEPRLVHWTYSPEDYEEVEVEVETKTDDGVVMSKERQMVLKKDAVQTPDGVQYERVTVLLLDVVKRQEERIKALEAAIARISN